MAYEPGGQINDMSGLSLLACCLPCSKQHVTSLVSDMWLKRNAASQDTSSSGANIKRLEKESADAVAAIEADVARKKRLVRYNISQSFTTLLVCHNVAQGGRCFPKVLFTRRKAPHAQGYSHKPRLTGDLPGQDIGRS
jgi:hypothetical protein